MKTDVNRSKVGPGTGTQTSSIHIAKMLVIAEVIELASYI